MILYHGTNYLRLQQIIADGRLKGPVYLSDSLDVARYFAKMQRRGYEGELLLLQVDVQPEKLAPDEVSLLDPIPMIQKKMGIIDIDAYFEELAQFEDESWIDMLGERAGIKGRPRWEISLALANAVRHDGNIPLKNVTTVF